jgi:hypothetical protein
MAILRLLTVCLALAAPALALSAEPPRTDSDCAALLERWATDPKVAPKSVIDACKAQLAGPASAPTDVLLADDARQAPLAASLDPCAGPDAASSVLCWGPWASLAPAAGPPLLDDAVADVLDPDIRPELANPYDPEVEPLAPPEPPALPLGSCAPGTPCGFATLVAGLTSTGEPENTTFQRFTMADDGTQFTVDPGGPSQINSVPGMTTNITPRETDDYGNLRANGRNGDEQSRLVARVVQEDGQQGPILLAADIWAHGNRVTNANQSGYFAWGTTTSQAGLNALNAGNVSVSFAGPMSVDNSTVASLRIDFGANPVWTGTWTNPGYSFGAGGVVTGADLISEAGKFSANVVKDGSFVQGAMLGEAGQPRGVAHIINVRLADQRLIRDVGLLREVAQGPVQP